TLTVAREANIGRMPVQSRGCQDMRLIDRHALRLVECGGITMINMSIVFEVERYTAPIIGTHRHVSGRDGLNRAERSVLHPHAAREAQKHHPATTGKIAAAAFSRNIYITAKLAMLAQLLAGCNIEVTHFGV